MINDSVGRDGSFSANAGSAKAGHDSVGNLQRVAILPHGWTLMVAEPAIGIGGSGIAIDPGASVLTAVSTASAHVPRAVIQAATVAAVPTPMTAGVAAVARAPRFAPGVNELLARPAKHTS